MPDQDDIVVRAQAGVVLRPKRWSGDTHADLGGTIDEEASDALLGECAAEIVHLRAEVDRYEEIRLRDDAVIRRLQATNLTRYEETSDE